MGELGGFINSQSYDNIIIGGDFNTDFNNLVFRTSLLNNFMVEHDLVAIDTAFSSLIGHTFERAHDDGQFTSWPDHFLINSAFASNFKVVKSLRFSTNLSDHHPLCADIVLDALPHAPINNHQSKRFFPKVNWDKVSLEQLSCYNVLVANNLPHLSSNNHFLH